MSTRLFFSPCIICGGFINWQSVEPLCPHSRFEQTNHIFFKHAHPYSPRLAQPQIGQALFNKSWAIISLRAWHLTYKLFTTLSRLISNAYGIIVSITHSPTRANEERKLISGTTVTLKICIKRCVVVYNLVIMSFKASETAAKTEENSCCYLIHFNFKIRCYRSSNSPNLGLPYVLIDPIKGLASLK